MITSYETSKHWHWYSWDLLWKETFSNFSKTFAILQWLKILFNYTIYFSEGMWRKHYEDIGYLDKDSRQITAKKLCQQTNWNSTSNNISWNDSPTVSDSNQKFPHDFMVVFVNALEPICFKKFNFSEILTNYIIKIVLVAFLKLLRESNSLISIKVASKILGPKNHTVTVPLNTVFYTDNFKLFCCHKIITSFITEFKNLVHDKRKTTIYYFIHSTGKGLWISNVYWERVILAKILFKSRSFIIKNQYQRSSV